MGDRHRRSHVLALLKAGNPRSAGDIARALNVSRQMAHRHLRSLVDDGQLLREGAGRATLYRDAGSLPLLRHYAPSLLAEDRVWADIVTCCPSIGVLRDRAKSTLEYMFTEMLNNAIEHADASSIVVRFEAAPRGIAFEVIDDGIGIFRNLRRHHRFETDLEALQALSKGKLTTMPDRHTGEGVFFTSKAARRFEIESGDLRWIVDNVLGDIAVGVAAGRKGTRVRAEGARNPARSLADLFAEYTDEFKFSKTRVVVKLFAIGTHFVSRSEARRLLQRLDRFRHVVLDFKGVDIVGQGFVDEVFRVWARAHRSIRVDSTHMAPPVAFMVNRARRIPRSRLSS